MSRLLGLPMGARGADGEGLTAFSRGLAPDTGGIEEVSAKIAETLDQS